MNKQTEQTMQIYAGVSTTYGEKQILIFENLRGISFTLMTQRKMLLCTASLLLLLFSDLPSGKFL